ncbi:MAG: hypothetical protein HYX27_09400 [Acidobacteria bacterium]|nr:hypothetical protein [Acidobacteriota bacterium]
MSDWSFAQQEPEEQLARLEHYSVIKKAASGDKEIFIALYEYHTPQDPAMKFVARADQPLYQKTAPVVPIGWGNNRLTALSACMAMIRKFPFEE